MVRPGRLVLIVDRDLDFVEDLRTLLRDHRTLSARSMTEAVEIVVGGRIDVAILGPSFGSEAGVRSAGDLFDADPGLSVVLVANIVTNRVLRAALQMGFADVVDTPVTMRKLGDAIDRSPDRQAPAPARSEVPQAPDAASPERTSPEPTATDDTAEHVLEFPPPSSPEPATEVPRPAPPRPAPPVEDVELVFGTTASSGEVLEFSGPATGPTPERELRFDGPDPAPEAAEPRPLPHATPPREVTVQRAEEPTQEMAPPAGSTAPAGPPPGPPPAATVSGAPAPPPGPPPTPPAPAPAAKPTPIPANAAPQVSSVEADRPDARALTGRGQVITVMSGKAGSGKTVAATNLAAAMSERLGPDRVVIVDLDLQFGDVALLLQLEPTRTVVDAAHAIDGLSDARLDAMLLRHETGLRVLPAPLLPLAPESTSIGDLITVLERLKRMYEAVIVDTSPIFGPTLLSVLDHSDTVILLVDMDLPSVKNAKIAIDQLRGDGFPEDRVRLVVNRVNSKARLDLVELERSLGLRVAGSIPSDRIIPQSVNEGIPAVVLTPRSRVAKSFHSLAEKFAPDAARRAS